MPNAEHTHHFLKLKSTGLTGENAERVEVCKNYSIKVKTFLRAIRTCAGNIPSWHQEFLAACHSDAECRVPKWPIHNTSRRSNRLSTTGENCKALRRCTPRMTAW